MGDLAALIALAALLLQGRALGLLLSVLAPFRALCSITGRALEDVSR